MKCTKINTWMHMFTLFEWFFEWIFWLYNQNIHLIYSYNIFSKYLYIFNFTRSDKPVFHFIRTRRILLVKIKNIVLHVTAEDRSVIIPYDGPYVRSTLRHWCWESHLPVLLTPSPCRNSHSFVVKNHTIFKLNPSRRSVTVMHCVKNGARKVRFKSIITHLSVSLTHWVHLLVGSVYSQTSFRRFWNVSIKLRNVLSSYSHRYWIIVVTLSVRLQVS